MTAGKNPFASKYTDALPYRFSDTDMVQLMERLAQLDFKAAIIGPHGTGKTTLLEQLGRHLEEKGFPTVPIRFDSRNRRLPRGLIHRIKSERTPRHAYLIDGVEQLSRLAFARLRAAVRTAGAVIVTSHAPCRLPTLITTRTTPELLGALVEELLGTPGRLPENDIRRLFHAHGGNIRNALRELYDQWA